MNEPALRIETAGEKGRGVFTADRIIKGARILAFQGSLFAGAQLPDELLAMQVGPDLWLASDGSAIDDCVNHSCEPNSGFVYGEPILYALRDIAAGEEITWDYSTSINEAGWTLKCVCGEQTCRRIIRPWHELAAVDRERLRWIALNYLRHLTL